MVWRRSSFSRLDACVEVSFTKSTRSGGNGCVEVGHATGHVHVRDSDDPAIVTTHSTESWKAFIEGVKAGEFDL